MTDSSPTEYEDTNPSDMMASSAASADRQITYAVREDNIMNIDALNILADAISDVGSWHWWLIRDDMVQVQFCDIMLYDENTAENEPHSTDILAVRFRGNAFAVFLDNLNDEKWYERLLDDDSVIYPIDTYNMAFDDRKAAERVLNDYRHRTVIKDFNGSETLQTAGHLLCTGCDDVGFIVGGDELEVVGKKGKYTEEEIETAYGKWCDYWKAYWKLRGTKDAYPKDYVCEVSIPIGKE